MSQEKQQPQVAQEDWSYESRQERRSADAQLHELRKNRDARHEKEKKQLAETKCFLKRWAIKCRADRQDWQDEEQEQELLKIANPVAALMH